MILHLNVFEDFGTEVGKLVLSNRFVQGMTNTD